MLPIANINGRFIDQQDAVLHVSDLAILRGYGVFDYFRFADGKPRFLSDHLERFARSARSLGLELPFGKSALADIIQEVIDKNNKLDGGVRLVLTGGYASDGYTPAEPNLLVLAYIFTPPPAALYVKGCSIMVHPFERQIPTAKTIDYVEGIRLQPRLREAGVDYVLYADRHGNVKESDRSNFLSVFDGKLVTPEEGLLPGVTLRHVIRLAAQLGIEVERREIHYTELQDAQEILICSSVKGILPATRLGGGEIGGGGVGPVTKRLMEAWESYLEEEA